MGIVSVTFFCSECMNSSGLSELLVQDKPALCFKCLFHVLKEALVLYFLLHVAFRLVLGLSEWARARANYTFLLCECYEIQITEAQNTRWFTYFCHRHCSLFLFV